MKVHPEHRQKVAIQLWILDSGARQKVCMDRSPDKLYSVTEKESDLKGREYNRYEEMRPKEVYCTELAGSSKSVMPNLNIGNMAQMDLEDNKDHQMAYYYQGYKKALEEMKRVIASWNELSTDAKFNRRS